MSNYVWETYYCYVTFILIVLYFLCLLKFSTSIDSAGRFTGFGTALTTILPIFLVQAFLKKWWVESDFKALNLPLSLRLKGSGFHYNSIYNNTGKK
jgi:hypothetical protein